MSSTVQNQSNATPCWINPVNDIIAAVGFLVPVVGIVSQVYFNCAADKIWPAKDDASAYDGRKIDLNNCKNTNKLSVIRNAITVAALAGVITAVALGVLGGGAVVIGAAAITAAVVLIDSAFRMKAIREYGNRADALPEPERTN